MMKKPLPVYPIFFAVYPILAYFVHNLDELKAKVIFWPLLISLGASLLVWLAVNFVSKNFKRSAVLVFLGLSFFFSYGHLINALGKLIDLKLIVKLEVFFLIVWTIIFLLLSRLVFRLVTVARKLDQLTRFLNIVALVLGLIFLVQIAYHELEFRLVMAKLAPERRQEIKQAQPEKGTRPPDIYYLIFDRYASADSLKKYYFYDNSDFLDFLTQKGFYVVPRALANYPITDLSLASSLNMEYLDSLSLSVGSESTDFRPIYAKFNHHLVGDFLKKRGYLLVNVPSTWWLTRQNKQADINYLYTRPRSLSIFLLKFLETTALHPFFSGSLTVSEKNIMEPLTFEALSREIILNQFKILSKTPNLPGPKFVFAHVLLPHEPYVFDRDGRFISKREALAGERRKLYLNQLVYANKLIKSLVEELMAKTKGQAIIILQGDEGPFPPRYKKYEYSFEWQKATPDEIKEKFGILNAYFLPGVSREALHFPITPVNSFRLIFNLYFKTNLAFLPDRIYGIKDRRHPYQYYDLTGKINSFLSY